MARLTESLYYQISRRAGSYSEQEVCLAYQQQTSHQVEELEMLWETSRRGIKLSF